MGMNPSIYQVEIGSRKTRTVNIYPLSIADQLKISNKISDVLITLSELDGKQTKDVLSIVSTLIEENLIEILKYVADEEISLDDLTNNQASEIAKIIYEVNFETTIKNLKDLFQKAQNNVLGGKRSLPESASTPVTK